MVPRLKPMRGTDLTEDVLVAMTVGVALALLGTTTWLWALR
jgi:hypothetical protein